MNDDIKPPKLVKRREHKNSSFRAGRTIGEKREKLETKKERVAARKKDKNKKTARIIFTLVGFSMIVGILVVLFSNFIKSEPVDLTIENQVSYEPTIEIIDENTAHDGEITARMRDFIGQVEISLKEYDIKATKVVIPSGSIREVRFYLDGHKGFIKMLIDREAEASAEDTERMLKYLNDKGVNEFEYIDVRIEGRAYWK